MHFYTAYGLSIESAIALPELLPTIETTADVVIKFGKVDCSLMKPYRGSELMSQHVTTNEVAFYWREAGAMQVNGNNEIIIDPLPDVEERMLHLPLLGMIFAVMLHQRGILTLHGSAVEIDGSAAIFLGGKGWGKSTLAATLYARGHQLITDDLVAVNFTANGNPLIVPGFPQLKLLPEAAAFALGDDPDTLPEIAKGFEKRARRGIERFSSKSLPIKAIYQIDKGPTLAIKPLNPQEAVLQIIANSFIARCTDALLEGNSGVKHFQQCMNLVKLIPISRLERPQSLELVTALAQLVENNHAAILEPV
jgi:hypothetical protein